MFKRYQVRIRRRDHLHTFAVRLNAMRGHQPGPKALDYRIALGMVMIQTPAAVGTPKHRAQPMRSLEPG